MAYKFQLGSAILSGSTKFEQEVDAAGGLKLTGVDDTALDVSADSFLFRDADGTMKRDSMADYATAIAGDGLSADAGVLEVEVSELAAVTAIASGDTFAIAQEAETGDPTRKITFDNMAVKLAGDGLASSSGVLSVGVDDSSIETNSDALRIKDSGVTAAKLNTDVISAQVELAHADIADADELMISDGGVLKKTGVDSLRDHFFGVVSGDATVADGGALTIAANAVEDSMVNDNVATGLAGVGLSAASGVLAVDASELSDAAVASGDKFVFQDATDDSTKKESIDDIATFMAGSGLKAEAGVLEVRVSGSIVRNNDKIGISGSIAGIGLSFDGGADSISGLDLDLNELTGGAIANGDFLAFVDADDSNVTKKEAVADLATLFAGSGLVASAAVMAVNVDDTGIEIDSDVVRLKDNGVTLAKMAGLAAAKFILGDSNGDPAAVTMSGDATMDNAGAITIAANAVEDSMVNDNVATGLAGNGLSAASGVLAVGVDDSGIEINSDALRLKDNGVTLAKMAGITRGSIISGDASGDPQALAVGSAHQFLQSDGTDLAYVSMSGDATLAAGVLSIGATKVTDAMMNDDVATGLAGDGLAAASGVLSVGVDDSTIETNSDALRLKDNGVTLAKMAGLARGKFIIGDSSGDPSALALGSAAQFLVSDGDDLLYRSLSGDATMNAAGALTISADAVEGSMLNDNVISGQTDIGGPIAEADELLISDNGSLRRTDVSRLRAMTVAAKADGDTLATGVNYFADLTSDAGVTLPASPQPGDKVIVKAKGLSSAVITISRAGSHTIDGETSVVIESPFGAVTCVYVAVNDWRLI